MKNKSFTLIAVFFSSPILHPSAFSQVPGIINYQGRVVDGGTNFTGTGQFEFALVNGSAGTTNYWSNDGSPVGQPSHTVSLTVTKGLYSVLLGDTTIANMTLAIAPTVFSNSDVRLRVWFNDGVSGFQQLSPDQRLAAGGYAMMAAGVNSSGDIIGNRLNIGQGHSLGGILASIAGGSSNSAYSDYSTIGGGFGNTIDNFTSYLDGYSGSANVLGGGLSNSITPFSSENFLGGGSGNGIGSAAGDNFLGGGSANFILGDMSGFDESGYNTLVGGFGNEIGYGGYFNFIGSGSGNQIRPTANGIPPYYDVIGGGYSNLVIDAEYDIIGGGSGNQISSSLSGVCEYNTIGGGLGNFISGGGESRGIGSTIPGGVGNTVLGNYCFAAGHQAQATNDGAFVWADSSGTPFASTSTNQFSVRAAGGVRFFTNAGATLGAQLAPNATAWTTLSDRDAKENIEPISVRDILNELVTMPISKWNYKDDPAQRRYIGPMAQDFHSAFGLGDDDKRISTLDSESVALAAIQGLNQKLEQTVKEKDGQIEQLHREMGELKMQMQKISEQVEQSKAAPIPAANVHEQGGM
jgi:trimeric autotransporter adhesin